MHGILHKRQGEGRLTRFWKACSYWSDAGIECVVRVSSRWWGASLGPTLTTAARETR